MKKILLTLATLFSSHVFASGNLQSMQGRFMVNGSRCNMFQKNTPTRAYISVQSSSTLLVEFLGSEARELIVRTETGEDMGRNGRESFAARWTTPTSLESTRNFMTDEGRPSREVVTLSSTAQGLSLKQTVDGRTSFCELNRNR